MNEMIIGRAGRFSGNTSGSANSPQQSSCHCFANSFVVSLFMGYSKRFGVNAQKKLRHAFPGQTHLNVDGGAVIQNLRMRTMMQLTISPQPKRRSSMGHFLRTPFRREAVDHKGRTLKYGQISKASINFNKRYRCNVLAPKKIDGEMVTTRITNDENVSRHEER